MLYVSRLAGDWFGDWTGQQYYESSTYLAPLDDFFMAAEPEIRGLSTVTMQVIVELHSGRLITIEPSIDGTVDDAMQMTEDKTGIPAHLLLLNFEGKQLESGRRLSDCDIRRESTIRQGFALLGGGGKKRGGYKLCEEIPRWGNPPAVADAPPGLLGVADISYEDDLVFVGGWARKGLQEWHVVEAVFNAVGTRPASTFPCQKKGLILKFSNPILVARILEMGLFAEGHKLVVGPVRKPVKKTADSSSSDADVESVLIEVRKCTSKPTVRNAGSQTVLTGVALRTIIDGLHSDLKFLTGCLSSMSEGDPPDARSLTSRCSQPHWTLASTLDPAQRGKPDTSETACGSNDPLPEQLEQTEQTEQTEQAGRAIGAASERELMARTTGASSLSIMNERV